MEEMFSIIILCYRHFEYLYSAINSVLEQDYPNVELIISDDCSPDFPRKEIEQYIEKHRRANIIQVIIRREVNNVGTVRNLNHAISASGGAYVAALAGDDMLASKDVLSRYVRGFSHAPKGCLIEMAQTGMYDEELEEFECYYLKPAARAALEKTASDTKDLLRLLIREGACLPSVSTCFRREFFHQFGAFDEEYRLVEDYPTHVRLAKNGYVIHYEDFEAVKHRDGGISHGQTDTTSIASLTYLQDSKKMLERIVMPNIECLPKEERWETEMRWERERLRLARVIREKEKIMIGKKNLFSVIILCYRRFEYIYSAIDSVLMQDYPNMELIISDDGSPEFPGEAVRRYVEHHRGKNLVRTIVRQENENVGTVRHLNHVVQFCSGTYIVALAGDDNLWDDSVLSRYALGFSRAPEDCLIEMAQTAMFDETMEKLEGFYLKPAVQAAIEKTERDTSDLRHLLIRDMACLPSTSTCFRKEFFQKFGPFDERYTLIEDYPMHMRLAEENWTIHYENFVAIKHRHGGISHGREKISAQTSALYFQDTARMIREIVLPNLDCLSNEERRKVVKDRKADLLWLEMQIAKSQKDYKKLAAIVCRHPAKAYWWLTDTFWPFIYAWHIKPLLLCVAMWAGIPVMSDMAALILDVEAEALQMALYSVALIMFGLWVVLFLVWVVGQLRWRLHRYPGEALAIG